MDFFRGVMAIIVAVGHLLFWNGKLTVIPQSFVLAVDFFLVLSGFVLAQSVLLKNNICSFTFAKKRYLRIAPVFLFASLVTVPIALYLKSLPLPNLTDLFRIITISGIFPMNARSDFIYPEPLGIAWTISAELWIGVIFFPLIFYVNKVANPLLFPMLLSFTVACILIINIQSPDFMNVHYAKYTGFITYGLIRTLMDYSLGAIAFIYKDKILSFNDDKMHSLLQIGLIIIFILLYGKIDYNRGNELYAPIVFMLFICSLSKHTGVIYKLFSGKVGEFMGDISFPSYMMHPLLIIMFMDIMHLSLSASTIIIFAIMLMIISKLVNVFIEKPCLKILR